jgi:hypothetical protein
MADGEKQWTLFSGTSSALINPPAVGRGYYFSKIDLRKPDLSNYPGFDLLSRYVCTLKKGDILFVPTWMWHEVENITEGWAVAYRFASVRGFVRHPVLAFVRLFLTRPSLLGVFYNLVIVRTDSKARTSVLTPRIFND